MTKARAAAFLLALAGCAHGPTSMGLRAEPQMYSPAMSSTPGISLTPLYSPPGGALFRWRVNFGTFFTQPPGGRRVELGTEALMGPGMIYWTYEPTAELLAAVKPTVEIEVWAEDPKTRKPLAVKRIKLDWEGDLARVR